MKQDEKKQRPKLSVEEREQLLKDMVDKKRSQSDVAREFGISRQAVSLWVKKYKADGTVMTGIATMGRPNKRLPPEARAEVVDILQTTWPADHGFESIDGQWDMKSIGSLLKKRVHDRFTYSFCLKLFVEAAIEGENRHSSPPPEPKSVEEREQRPKAPAPKPAIDPDAEKLTRKHLEHYEKKVAEAQEILKEKGLSYDPMSMDELKYGRGRPKKKGSPVTQSKKKKNKSKKQKKRKGKKRK